MVNNPLWHKPQGEFQDQLYRWVYPADADAQMNLAILSMPKPWPATRRCCSRPRTICARSCPTMSGFPALPAPIEQFDTPLGLFSQLLTKSQGGVSHAGPEKKKRHLPHRARHPRHGAGVQTGNQQHAGAHQSCWWIRATWNPNWATTPPGTGFLAGNAPESRAGYAGQRQDADNQIQPDRLSTLERDLLKDALAVVKRCKTTIRHHFKMTGFLICWLR